MITYNESHFIKYSLPNLLRCVDYVLVLDGSNKGEGTREYLESLDNVIVFYEEFCPEIKTYKDRRQFLLDRGRMITGSHFIVIDADEILSEELINYLNNNDWNDAIYCKWWHVGNKLNLVNENRLNDTQGIAFVDKGINYHGNEYVHEDKIPIGREENYVIVNYPLFHFGMCNTDYINIKESYYKCLSIKEGYPIYRINLDYLNNYSNVIYTEIQKYHYPSNINEDILNIDKSMKNKLFELVKKNYMRYYDLDIWSDELINYCNKKCILFKENLIYIKQNESHKIKYFKIMYQGFKYNLEWGKYMNILKGMLEMYNYLKSHVRYRISKFWSNS